MVEKWECLKVMKMVALMADCSVDYWAGWKVERKVEKWGW